MLMGGEASGEGCFHFSGTRIVSGRLCGTDGFLEWAAFRSEVKGSGENCKVEAVMAPRLHPGDHGFSRCDPSHPYRYTSDSLEAAIPRRVLRGLGSDCMDSRNEFIRLIGMREMGFDVRATSKPPEPVRGYVFVMGMLERSPWTKYPMRVAGKVFWHSEPHESGIAGRRKFSMCGGSEWVSGLRRIDFDIDEEVDRGFVGDLVAGDRRTQIEVAAMISGQTRDEGMVVHSPAV